jgi:hypothetical protein
MGVPYSQRPFGRDAKPNFSAAGHLTRDLSAEQTVA